MGSFALLLGPACVGQLFSALHGLHSVCMGRLPPLAACLAGAAALRLGLVLYTVLCDQLGAARFTDVDYLVFSDAAKLVDAGRSPYERATYRYTPLLALLLAPLLRVHESAGKVLFCLGDFVVAWCALCGHSSCSTGDDSW